MSSSVYRQFQRLLLLSTLLILGAVYYLQYVGGLKPCPLCIIQRVCVILFGISCIVGWCFSARYRKRVVAFFQILFSFSGLFFATRQLWIQSLPAEQVPACLPGLDILMKYYPLRDILSTLFWGTGDCAEVSWQLFGLSMPAWAALYFLAIFLVSGWVFFFLRPSLVRRDS